MILRTHRRSVQLDAEFGHADITPELVRLVRESALRDGVLTVVCMNGGHDVVVMRDAAR